MERGKKKKIDHDHDHDRWWWQHNSVGMLFFIGNRKAVRVHEILYEVAKRLQTRGGWTPQQYKNPEHSSRCVEEQVARHGPSRIWDSTHITKLIFTYKETILI